MSDWIKLKTGEFDQREKHVGTDGVEVTLFLSPFDVPKAVRGHYDEKHKQFVIEFRYLSGADDLAEPVKETVVEDHFRFYDGKLSHRIYRIEIDVVKLRATGVQLQVAVVDAIEQFKGHDRPKNRGRYDVNREVIEKRQEELFKELV